MSGIFIQSKSYFLLLQNKIDPLSVERMVEKKNRDEIKIHKEAHSQYNKWYPDDWVVYKRIIDAVEVSQMKSK